MSSPSRITIHPSQFPDAVSRDLLESLRRRQVSHKFHYDSIKQTQKWLALHRAYSPSRTDAGCAEIYDLSFDAIAAQIESPEIHLIGLGCGGGQKDARLLRRLIGHGREVDYTPSDVSVAMVLVARESALTVIPETKCHPFVCDLGTAGDLPDFFKQQPCAQADRLFTFFGMIPNFPPQTILPKLAALIRPSDQLLFSANLAPGMDYEAGVQQVLPLYDNALTRDWLMTFLTDLGVEPGDGEMRFGAEDEAASGLKRIVADFCFRQSRVIMVGDESFSFATGEKFRLFYSYRHTPEIIGKLLSRHGLAVREQWITKSGEEGVFSCSRK